MISRLSCLHGVHWPHDSTTRDRDTLAATAVMWVASSSTMNAAAPTRADLLHPLPARRRVELVGGDDRGSGALQHRPDSARGRAPPPTVSMISRSVVPIVNSPTPACVTHPLTVRTTVPSDSSVPTSRNQSAPSARRPRRAPTSRRSDEGGGRAVSAPHQPSRRGPTAHSDVRSPSVSTISSTPRRYSGAIRKGSDHRSPRGAAVSSPSRYSAGLDHLQLLPGGSPRLPPRRSRARQPRCTG